MRGSFIHRRSILKAALCGVTFTTLPISAFAHRQKQAVSTVVWNERTKLLEITHIFHLHDAEQALTRLGKLDSPDLTPRRARGQLALYAREHFTLLDANGTPIRLKIIGAEVENGQIYVYQEVAFEQMPHTLSIINTLLLDVYTDQTNLVNVTLGTHVKSLVFKAGDGAKMVTA